MRIIENFFRLFLDEVGLDLEDLLDVQLDEVIELLVVTDEQNSHRWQIALLMLDPGKELAELLEADQVILVRFGSLFLLALVIFCCMLVCFLGFKAAEDKFKVEKIVIDIVHWGDMSELRRDLDLQNLIL